MIGTLWKCRKGKIYILKRTYMYDNKTRHYVFIRPSGNTLTLRDFFVDRSMTKIT